MSKKKSIITGKDFYIFNEIFEEEKGVFIKLFNPEEVKFSTNEGKVREIDICISKKQWEEFKNKIKQHEEEDL